MRLRFGASGCEGDCVRGRLESLRRFCAFRIAHSALRGASDAQGQTDLLQADSLWYRTCSLIEGKGGWSWVDWH